MGRATPFHLEKERETTLTQLLPRDTSALPGSGGQPGLTRMGPTGLQPPIEKEFFSSYHLQVNRLKGNRLRVQSFCERGLLSYHQSGSLRDRLLSKPTSNSKPLLRPWRVGPIMELSLCCTPEHQHLSKGFSYICLVPQFLCMVPVYGIYFPGNLLFWWQVRLKLVVPQGYIQRALHSLKAAA